MGFSKWRGKVSERPIVVDAVATGVDAEVNPDAELKKFKKIHKWDPFLDIDKLDVAEEALATGDYEKEKAVEEALHEDSPYPEVRSSVCFIPRNNQIVSYETDWRRSNPSTTPICPSTRSARG